MRKPKGNNATENIIANGLPSSPNKQRIINRTDQVANQQIANFLNVVGAHGSRGVDIPSMVG